MEWRVSAVREEYHWAIVEAETKEQAEQEYRESNWSWDDSEDGGISYITSIRPVESDE